MCNLDEGARKLNVVRVCKRKLFSCDNGEIYIPTKRISPSSNTPKEKKDERKHLLKLSMKKLKEIDNAERCLRRALLIQNAVRQLQKELQLDKQAKRWRNGVYTAKTICRCNIPSIALKDYLMYHCPDINPVNETITDDMTDTLMKNLEDKIGERLRPTTTSGGSRQCVTPSLTINEIGACHNSYLTHVPVERNGHRNAKLQHDIDKFVIPVIYTDRNLESLDCRSGIIEGNSKGSYPGYEYTQAHTQTENGHVEIDGTTRTDNALEIPFDDIMDTTKPIITNKFNALETTDNGSNLEKGIGFDLPPIKFYRMLRT